MDSLIKKINNILEKAIVYDNYDSIMSELSFEERKMVLEKDSSTFRSLYYHWKEIYANLFSSDEAKEMYNIVTSVSDKNALLYSCSDEFKLGLASDFNGNIYDYFSSFIDDNLRLKAFEILLSKGKIESFQLDYVISKFDNSYLESLIDKICEYNRFDLSFSDIADILEKCPEELREGILNKFLKSLIDKNDKKISIHGLDKIFVLFPNDKYVDILNKFNVFFNDERLDINVFSIGSLLKKLGDDKLRVFKAMIDGGYFKNLSFVYNIFEDVSDEEKNSFLDILLEYDIKNNSKVVDLYNISKIIMSYSEEKRLEIFKKYILESNRYNHIMVINYFDDINFKFETLNLKLGSILSNCTEEEKKDIFNLLFDIISGYEDKVPNGDVIYSEIINFFADSLKINKDNLIKFINRFGYISLRYLDNYNVISVINLDKDNFDRFMLLFDKKSFVLDDGTRNNVIHSLLQREFLVQCKNDYNIFSRFEMAINNSSFEEVQNIFMELSNVINIKKILSKYNMDVKDFIDGLLVGKEGMLDILHDMTNLYIMKKRELYVNGRFVNINEELDLDKKYEKNFIKKKWVATNSLFDIIWDIKQGIDIEKLTVEQNDLIANEDIMKSIIKFKKSPSEYVLKSEYKKYLKVFDSLVDMLYEKNKLDDPTNDPNAKYVYFSKFVALENMVDLISELDIVNLNKFLLSDNDRLDKLIGILRKYKLLGWGNTFSALRDSADFDFSNNTLAGLFNYFYRIDSELSKDQNFSLTKMLSLANCYASSASKYGLLFGDEVFRLIAANEGKNKASMVKYKRLELGVEHVIGMYNREVIPVPSIDDNITISNGKEFNVVVGNTTNMRNLALGEFTNSCMRIGGAFYDFYKECLEGKVGFHIVLLEPGTNNFISRVSGIRNGNTLFLNELRSSECEGYVNEDCVDVIRIVAKKLVENSKNSEFPIDNVVITSDYAMEEHKDELIDLHLSDRKEALYGLNHNLDNADKAILLASSSEDNKLVDISLGKDKISYYKPQRDKVREFVGEEAVRRVIQLGVIINNLLNGVSFADINVDLNIDVIRCISGSDWYIAVDSNGNYSEFVLDNCRDKERALEEVMYYKNRLIDGNGKGVSK